MFEPFYDSYGAAIAMAGAQRRVVPLEPPDWSFDPGRLAAAVTPRTRLILLNSPHNPTGKVFSRQELELVAACCVEHDLLAVTDEVYEHLVFEGRHEPLCTLPGMAERTVTVSSAGKTFAFTGWKVGWVCGPEPLVAGGAHRQAVPHLRQRGALPTGGGRRIGPARRVLQWGRPGAASGAGPAMCGAGCGRIRGVPTARDLFRHYRRCRVWRHRRDVLLPDPARTLWSGGSAGRGVLRRSPPAPATGALCLLQAAGSARRRRAPAGAVARVSADVACPSGRGSAGPPDPVGPRFSRCHSCSSVCHLRSRAAGLAPRMPNRTGIRGGPVGPEQEAQPEAQASGLVVRSVTLGGGDRAPGRRE